MAEPFLGEIRMFALGFTVRGWAPCDGRLLPIAQNAALFSLLGTTYGGDGRVTFALPDLRGRAPLGAGQGPGLSDRRQGSTLGAERVILAPAQMPAHAHGLAGVAAPATEVSPAGQRYAEGDDEVYGAVADTAMAQAGAAGGAGPHENQPPSLAIAFQIALVGVFPPRG
ncbi:MAG: phage tail protein [Myxococcales bacterium]|nr:phage tail protein [Myxococcales bacterium]